MENEQLKKEVGYHIQQTEVLRLHNEKLINEIGEVTRSLQLAKEVRLCLYMLCYAICFRFFILVLA